MRILFLSLFFFTYSSLEAQPAIDVQHYRFELALSDANDTLHGITTVRMKTVKPLTSITLNLHNIENGKGMKVQSIRRDGTDLMFMQQANVLAIQLPSASRVGEEMEFTIRYKGIPKDGLIIDKNKYGDRTYFADNWPNRAHYWLPVNDIPSDKATFEFIVTAPSRYQVISNGEKVEEKSLNNNFTLTHWKDTIPLPTKIMVIGVAKFATKTFPDSPNNIPVSAWVYPQDSTKGFYDYGISTDILKFFSRYIAPYPYKKLANVQSKTIFGGMENASAIFYSEQSVDGKRSSEGTIAHEIVHQWFGDMASEKDFSHLWLSEGFATYLTDIYYQHRYGEDKFRERLRKERQQIISFVSKSKHPVVDTTPDLMSLLNTNSYQKGSWVLHMLRNEVSDSTFHKIIQTYYQQYKGSNANTDDFRVVAEKVSGKNLKQFFQQWLYTPVIPKLKVEWKADGDKIKADITQATEDTFQFPLEVAVKLSNGKTIIEKVYINNRKNEIKIETGSKPVSLTLDPNVRVLFEQL
jgi:aminopeptidase N